MNLVGPNSSCEIDFVLPNKTNLLTISDKFTFSIFGWSSLTSPVVNFIYKSYAKFSLSRGMLLNKDFNPK